MNYYPFHIGDYLSATRHLSWEEDAAYRRLLDVYYTTEKALPSDLRQVCRLVLATTEEQRKAVETVLGEFFEGGPDGWVNHRADAEIVAMKEKQQKQRDRANKRWHKPDAEHEHTPALPRHTQDDATASKSDANAMPPTPTPTPTPTPILNTKEKRADAPELPDWMPVEAWDGFVEMRKKNKKPMTGRAAKLKIDILEKLRSEGHSPESVLDQSTANNWTDLYAPKAAGRVQPSNSEPDWSAKPKWVLDAGFVDVGDAHACMCWERNSKEFRNGKRILKVVG